MTKVVATCNGEELDYKDVKGTEYAKAVNLARIVESSDFHPKNIVAGFYDVGGMDPYNRRIITNENKKDY